MFDFVLDCLRITAVSVFQDLLALITSSSECSTDSVTLNEDMVVLGTVVYGHSINQG